MQRLQAASDGGISQRAAREILDAIPPLVWFIRREMRVYRKELSLTQFRALAMIHRQPMATLSAVAEHLGTSLPSVSRLIQGLVEQGLMKRTACQKDRRQLALAITDAGEGVLNTAWAGTQERLMVELRKLSPEERNVVAEAMQTLKGLFGTSGLGQTCKAVLKQR